MSKFSIRKPLAFAINAVSAIANKYINAVFVQILISIWDSFNIGYLPAFAVSPNLMSNIFLEILRNALTRS